MIKEILDLHGNKFAVGDFKLYLKIPLEKIDTLIYTRDYLSGMSFNLAKSNNKYYGYFYNLSLRMYVRFKLKLTGYDESSDIRKSYLYVNKRK